MEKQTLSLRVTNAFVSKKGCLITSCNSRSEPNLFMDLCRMISPLMKIPYYMLTSKIDVVNVDTSELTHTQCDYICPKIYSQHIHRRKRSECTQQMSWPNEFHITLEKTSTQNLCAYIWQTKTIGASCLSLKLTMTVSGNNDRFLNSHPSWAVFPEKTSNVLTPQTVDVDFKKSNWLKYKQNEDIPEVKTIIPESRNTCTFSLNKLNAVTFSQTSNNETVLSQQEITDQSRTSNNYWENQICELSCKQITAEISNVTCASPGNNMRSTNQSICVSNMTLIDRSHENKDVYFDKKRSPEKERFLVKFFADKINAFNINKTNIDRKENRGLKICSKKENIKGPYMVSGKCNRLQGIEHKDGKARSSYPGKENCSGNNTRRSNINNRNCNNSNNNSNNDNDYNDDDKDGEKGCANTQEGDCNKGNGQSGECSKAIGQSGQCTNKKSQGLVCRETIGQNVDGRSVIGECIECRETVDQIAGSRNLIGQGVESSETIERGKVCNNVNDQGREVYTNMSNLTKCENYILHCECEQKANLDTLGPTSDQVEKQDVTDIDQDSFRKSFKKQQPDTTDTRSNLPPDRSFKSENTESFEKLTVCPLIHQDGDLTMSSTSAIKPANHSLGHDHSSLYLAIHCNGNRSLETTSSLEGNSTEKQKVQQEKTQVDLLDVEVDHKLENNTARSRCQELPSQMQEIREGKKNLYRNMNSVSNAHEHGSGERRFANPYMLNEPYVKCVNETEKLPLVLGMSDESSKMCPVTDEVILVNAHSDLKASELNTREASTIQPGELPQTRSTDSGSSVVDHKTGNLESVENPCKDLNCVNFLSILTDRLEKYSDSDNLVANPNIVVSSGERNMNRQPHRDTADIYLRNSVSNAAQSQTICNEQNGFYDNESLHPQKTGYTTPKHHKCTRDEGTEYFPYKHGGTSSSWKQGDFVEGDNENKEVSSTRFTIEAPLGKPTQKYKPIYAGGGSFKDSLENEEEIKTKGLSDILENTNVAAIEKQSLALAPHPGTLKDVSGLSRQELMEFSFEVDVFKSLEYASSLSCGHLCESVFREPVACGQSNLCEGYHKSRIPQSKMNHITGSNNDSFVEMHEEQATGHQEFPEIARMSTATGDKTFTQESEEEAVSYSRSRIMRASQRRRKLMTEIEEITSCADVYNWSRYDSKYYPYDQRNPYHDFDYVFKGQHTSSESPSQIEDHSIIGTLTIEHLNPPVNGLIYLK